MGPKIVHAVWKSPCPTAGDARDDRAPVRRDGRRPTSPRGDTDGPGDAVPTSLFSVAAQSERSGALASRRYPPPNVGRRQQRISGNRNRPCHGLATPSTRHGKHVARICVASNSPGAGNNEAGCRPVRGCWIQRSTFVLSAAAVGGTSKKDLRLTRSVSDSCVLFFGDQRCAVLYRRIVVRARRRVSASLR